MANVGKKIIKQSAKASVKKLLDEARKAYAKGQKERSKKYVKMAHDLIKKNKIKLPEELRNSYCRKCFSLWVPGKTIKVTFDSRHNCLRITCKCGYTKRV